MRPISTLRHFNRKKFSKFNFKQLQIEFNKNPDIFFYEILLNEGKVDTFENTKKTKIMDIPESNKPEINFYTCFLKMSKDFIWNEFKLPYIYFKMLYFKARKLRKKIVQYALENKIRIIDVFESYNPHQKLLKKNEHNWEIPIEISYKRYFDKICGLTILKKDSNDNMYKYFDKTNLLILARTNIRKKKLIYSGNLCDIYLQNPDLREKKKLADELKNEHIIKLKDIYNQRKKRIKIRFKNNYDSTLEKNEMNKTLNPKRGFSLKKKVLKFNINDSNYLPSVNNSINKKNYSPLTFKLQKRRINIKNNFTLDSRLNSFCLSKEDFFYI